MKSKLEHSIDYITQKAGKKLSYKTPASYFNTLEDEILTKVSENTFSKQQGFSTPTSYFKTIEQDILNKTIHTKKKGTFLVLKNNFVRYSGLAAAACFLLGLFVYQDLNTNTITFDTLADYEIENWLANNTDNYSIAFEDISFDEHHFALTTISDESLEAYLQTEETLSILNELDEF